MAIFPFKCTDCNRHFTRIMKWDELQTEKIDCPECQSLSIVRMISTHASYNIKGDNSSSTRPKGGGNKG